MIQSSHVELKSGGSLVIEQTEALVAIDVNSGKYRKQDNAEQTAYKINQEAAREIVRQLKLRDLGGLIICDFIDMRDNKHRREVEKAFRNALRGDRARSRALRMSAFGLIELTRQRMRPSLQSSTYLECPNCKGTGVIKSVESQAIEIMRLLSLAMGRKDVKKVEISVDPQVADFLLNERRSSILKMEEKAEKSIVIHPNSTHPADGWEVNCFNERGSVVVF
jgi:ribonuclease E